MTKLLMCATPDGAPRELARFTLSLDGKVVARYRDAGLREEIEEVGILTVASGEVRPSDGRPFFDALELAYSRSTFVYVTTAE